MDVIKSSRGRQNNSQTTKKQAVNPGNVWNTLDQTKGHNRMVRSYTTKSEGWRCQSHPLVHHWWVQPWWTWGHGLQRKLRERRLVLSYRLTPCRHQCHHSSSPTRIEMVQWSPGRFVCWLPSEAWPLIFHWYHLECPAQAPNVLQQSMRLHVPTD